ncbi:hypothetical protein F5146DRAFT_1144008 [Armillaria mellea]|nr:hypothetical protein F5146DRAFT_1144008 [Armillaria mellea]
MSSAPTVPMPHTPCTIFSKAALTVSVSESDPPGPSRHNQKPILPHDSAPVQLSSTTTFKINNNFTDLLQPTLPRGSPQTAQGTVSPICEAEDWDDILAPSSAALMVQKLVDDTPEEQIYFDKVSLPPSGLSCWTSVSQSDLHTVTYDPFGDIPSPVSETWIANGYRYCYYASTFSDAKSITQLTRHRKTSICHVSSGIIGAFSSFWDE